MPNATNFLRTKASMLMIALLMVFSLVGGTLNPAGSGNPQSIKRGRKLRGKNSKGNHRDQERERIFIILFLYNIL